MIRTSQQKTAQAATGAAGLTTSQRRGQSVALLRILKK
jgi:hypothetical protein